MPPITAATAPLSYTVRRSPPGANHETRANFQLESSALHDHQVSLQSNAADSNHAEDKDQADPVSFRMPGLITTPVIPVSPSAYDEDVYCCFFLDKNFAFGNWNDDLQHNKAWLWQSLQHPSQWPISNLAARSLMTAFFGNVHSRQSLCDNALSIHSSTLKALTEALQEGHTDVSYDVLCAIALLILYEACLYTSRAAWRRHVTALKTLFQLKGPKYFESRPARALLMWMRYLMMSESILSRERCFLSEGPWLKILHSDDDESSVVLKLGDIVLVLPEIMEDIKTLEASNHKDEYAVSEAKRLLQALFNHLEELIKWWNEWSSKTGRLPVRVDATSLTGNHQMRPPPPMPGSSYSTILRFSNLEAASGYCRYHAQVIAAMRWINRLMALDIPHTSVPSMPNQQYLLPFRGTVQTNDDPAFGRQHSFIDPTQIVPHAFAIVEALHFYSTFPYRHVGATSIGMPARVAWQTLPPNSPHALWIEALMQFLGDTSGFVMPKYILKDLTPND